MPPSAPPTLADSALRALVLYSLAEFQSGHAKTIRVSAAASSFSVADDGRGHSIQRIVGNASYLRFVYTHLEYPFESGQCAPVQLQGIGMSLINAMCSDLSVTARRTSVTFRLSFRNGVLTGSEVIDVESSETGNSIAGTISPGFLGGIDNLRLETWLRAVQTACPSVSLFCNGREVQCSTHD